MTRELVEFLESKRWFGDKGRAIHAAELKDVIPIEWAGSRKPYAVARVEVTTDAGASTYQLFFERGTGRMSDALEDEEFRRGLADAFCTSARFAHGGVCWIAEREGKTPLTVLPTARIRLSPSEQSNTSVIIDDEAILKLFRRLEPGIHPDVEVTRFLTIERAFVHVPVLLGTIRFEDANGATVAGMLQKLVPDAVDAWTYALDSSRAYFTAPETREPELPFVADAERLGVVTRAMHEALASGDPGSEFEKQPVTAAHVRGWAEQAAEMIKRATHSLERAIAANKIPRAQLASAEQVAERGADYAREASRLADVTGSDAGAMARTHGDYHLGQVIRSAGGQFLVIDFEGEPARPLRDRRARHSPLRDVAGMLRSFVYCAAVGATGGGPHAGTRGPRWEQGARQAFLRGYFSTADSKVGGLLPRARHNANSLIALFEAEKIFYELQYELDHRPDWVWIPLRGIARLNT